MEWKDYPRNKPQKNGNYLISLKEPINKKDYYFYSFIARYDSAFDKWYQFDPISKNEFTNPIAVEIIGWMKLPPTFLG